jgi:hypothetical protein
MLLCPYPPESDSEKVRNIAMSPSAMTISLGLDETIDLNSLGLDCVLIYMQSGHQVADMILGGEIMSGYSRYRKQVPETSIELIPVTEIQ